MRGSPSAASYNDGTSIQRIHVEPLLESRSSHFVDGCARGDVCLVLVA
jgi:hypothetical protein